MSPQPLLEGLTVQLEGSLKIRQTNVTVTVAATAYGTTCEHRTLSITVAKSTWDKHFRKELILREVQGLTQGHRVRKW